MENLKIWWNDTLTPKGRWGIIILFLALVAFISYKAVDKGWIKIPGITFNESKEGSAMNVDNTIIDNSLQAIKLELPDNNLSKKVAKEWQGNLWQYTWNGNTGLHAANGGPNTTDGSLMEKHHVNLHIERKDSFDALIGACLSFVAEFDAGNNNPSSDASAFAVTIMGDGAKYFISVLNKMCDDKFGKGKYHFVVKGAIGSSYGEDKLIGPQSWIDNPGTMRGKVIITAVGDGDWVSSLNFIFANKGIKVNPNIGTYDRDAVNFVHNPDIIECANEFNASQLNGKTYELKEISNGKLTGKTVNVKLDGCATWLPGDKIVFDKQPNMVTVSSTKDFPNQMATTLIVLKEWSDKNPQYITNLLTATYEANNQIKLYDEWAVKASQCTAKTYGINSPKYWYDAFKGMKLPNGQVAGGSRVFNYADALQYYGLGEDGNNRYEAVYNQVGNYLKDLNPLGYVESVGNGVSYADAVDLSNLTSIKGISTGKVEKVDYSADKEVVMASGSWQINFNSGSSEILHSSDKELNELYNLLIQAEGSKITIEGHTDNTGNLEVNKVLSEGRANAVLDYLTNRGINFSRIQSVEGYGSSKPIGNNNTADGRYKNRRVQVVLLK